MVFKYTVKTSLIRDGAPKPKRERVYYPKKVRVVGVTGPFLTVEGYPFTSNKKYVLQRTSYRSFPKGSVYSLPYVSYKAFYETHTGSRTGYLSAGASRTYLQLTYSTSASQRYRALARNGAVSSLREGLDGFMQTYQGGESLGQAGKTMQMVTQRATQLYKGFKALKTGNLSAFCKSLQIQPKRKDLHLLGKRKRVQSNATSLWLEYWYGWKPLVEDINRGLNDLVDEPVWDRRFSGYGKAEWSSAPEIGPYESHGPVRVKTSCKVRAVVRVSDPNLYAANRGGLISPAQIAWQLVPFSFIVDWFVNVEQYLGSFTDFAGIELKFIQCAEKGVASGSDNVHDGFWDEYTTVRGYSLIRTQTLPEVTMRVKQAQGLSVSRAATSISLLVQLLGGKAGNRIV